MSLFGGRSFLDNGSGADPDGKPSDRAERLSRHRRRPRKARLLLEPLEQRMLFDGAGLQLNVTLQAQTLSGTPITSVTPGETFDLVAYVQDARAMPYGVFSAYTNVTYDSALATISPNANISFGSDFADGQHGNTSVAGVITTAGGFDPNTLFPANRGTPEAPGGTYLLWSVPVTASTTATAGTLTFTPSSADSNPQFATNLYNDGKNVLTIADTNFVPAVLTISGAAGETGGQAPGGADGGNSDSGDLPTISIDNPTVHVGPTSSAGETSTTSAVFTVTLSASNPSQPVTVDYAAQDGPGDTGAKTVSNYLYTAGTLTFAPGQTTATITVPLAADANETGSPLSLTFSLNLFNPVNASFGSATATTETGVGTLVEAPVPVVPAPPAPAPPASTAPDLPVSLPPVSVPPATPIQPPPVATPVLTSQPPTETPAPQSPPPMDPPGSMDSQLPGIGAVVPPWLEPGSPAVPLTGIGVSPATLILLPGFNNPVISISSASLAAFNVAEVEPSGPAFDANATGGNQASTVAPISVENFFVMLAAPEGLASGNSGGGVNAGSAPSPAVMAGLIVNGSASSLALLPVVPGGFQPAASLGSPSPAAPSAFNATDAAYAGDNDWELDARLASS